MRRRVLVAGLLGLVALAGCGAGYTYLPTDSNVALAGGQPATRYAIPPEAPEGDVELASYGVTDVQTDNGGSVRVMHVRMVIANNGGAQPWTVDTREIELELAGEGKSRAAFVNASGAGLPIVTIPPGQKQTLDLFFPLPQKLDEADRIAAFDVLWRVHAATRVFAERTTFERAELQPYEPPYDDYDYGMGFGVAPFWWYDPLWPSYTFVHPAPVIVGPSLHFYPHLLRQGGRYVAPRAPARPSPGRHR
jgi:hypothetical protein